MNVQIAVLCDAATDYGGKLNLLGAFDTLMARQWPATHPHCAVAVRVAFERAEEGPRELVMNLVDEDGQPVMPPIQIPFEVNVPADAIQISRNFIVNIQHLKFERPGYYALEVAVGQQRVAGIPLHVREAPETGPG
ncbi:MAG: hypothetical protein FJ387_25025 [Verrucomicrobia bacterium]|nr:hypothetical protein [Verrucomicrobiota bacterium]